MDEAEAYQVTHRIGGLEMHPNTLRTMHIVTHRIGGLEIYDLDNAPHQNVTHRIGGLEKTPKSSIQNA